jgi:2-polyprenyl-6-methoxyphenol hydroxylase-like FAD-dependent oxidoreductase
VQSVVPAVQQQVSPITWGYTNVAGAVYSNGGFPFSGAGGVPMMQCGVYMPMPVAEVPTPSRNRQVGDIGATIDASTLPRSPIPDWFLPLVVHLFGGQSSNTAYWTTVVERGKLTCHPVWELHGLDRVVSTRLALLGDAAHMASPRTGVGAYSAMLDALDLGVALQSAATVEEGLLLYNRQVLERGESLYQQGRWGADRHTRKDGVSISPVALLAAYVAGDPNHI